MPVGVGVIVVVIVATVFVLVPVCACKRKRKKRKWLVQQTQKVVLELGPYSTATGEEIVPFDQTDRINYQKLFKSKAIVFEDLKIGDCIGEGMYVCMCKDLTSHNYELTL